MKLGGSRAMLAAALVAVSAQAQLPALQDRPLSALERTRMTAIEASLKRISVQRNTSFAALRTIAQALGTKMVMLEPDQVVKLIDDRAQELVKARDRIQDMQAQLEQLDSMRLAKAVSPLLATARQAIDLGRLAEADSLLGQAAGRFAQARTGMQAQVDRIGVQEADVLAQQAAIRSSLSDFASAATLYAKGATLAEANDKHLAWTLRIEQSKALYNAGFEGGDGTAAALDVLQTKALPLAPRADRPEDWATTQYRIGITLSIMAQRSGSLDQARAAVPPLKLAVDATTAATPAEDRVLRPIRLATAMSRVAAMTRDAALSAEATALIRKTEAEQHPGTADFYADAAQVFSDRGDLLMTLGDKAGAAASMQDGIAALEKAAPLIDSKTKRRFYLQTRFNTAYQMTQLAVARGDPALADRAAALARSTLDQADRQQNPFFWGLFNMRLGDGLVKANLLRDPPSPASLTEAIGALDRATEVLTKDAWPPFRADVDYDRGQAFAMRARVARDPADYGAAIAAFESAATFNTREKTPDDWANLMVHAAGVRADQAAAGIDKAAALKDARLRLDAAAPIVAKTAAPELKSADADVRARLKALR